MDNLYAFLNPTVVENMEVVVSDRFKDKNGNIVPFVIRPIGQDESSSMMKRFTKKDKKTGITTVDRTALTAELVASAVVSPDLTNAELQSHYGVMGAASLLQKMLYVGEYNTLADKVQALSGLDDDINDEIDTVKN